VLAFGKLGGGELNYSSDIDLLAIYEPADSVDAGTERAAYTDVMTALNKDLTEHTVQGSLYRVDLRLRPYGSSGMLVYPVEAALRYYREHAADWELQAAIKLGPVAGNRDLARRFVSQLHTSIPHRLEPERVVAGIRKLREQKTRNVEIDEDLVDVKEGRGGIRDIEFLVQGLQLLHAHENADTASGDRPLDGCGEREHLEGNTIHAIECLRNRGILDGDTAKTLREDYVFLRKAEHVLQVAEDRQVHSLRRDGEDGEITARRMQQAQGMSEGFWPQLDEILKRAHRLYNEQLLERG
jgi:glutamate-ammonia-ligase adenylyltransferase